MRRANICGRAGRSTRGPAWYVEFWRDNVQHRESAHTDQEKRAVKLLRQRRDAMARDEFIRPRKVTMAELFDGVVADYKARDKCSTDTLSNRHTPLPTFLDTLRPSDVSDLQLSPHYGEWLTL